MEDGLEIRLFVEGDVPAFADLLNTVHGLEGSPRGFDAPYLAAVLGQPGQDMEQNCMLALQDGAPVGYAMVVPELPIERIVLDSGVHPDYRRGGVGSRLLEWGIARGQELGAQRAHTSVGENSHEAWAFLERHGYTPLRHYWEVRWEGAEIPVRLPKGVSLRTYEDGDAALLADVQNAAFSNQWGYNPNTAEQVAYKVDMERSSREGVLFLMRGDQAAGFCWTRLDGPPDNRVGIIWMVGVHPEHQGHGLGRIITTSGINHMLRQGVQAVELSVDSANTPARELYLSLGFQKVGGVLWYERSLAKG